MPMDYLNIRLSLAVTSSCFFSKCKLNPNAKLLLLQLINHINSKNLLLYPSLKRLARCCGCDDSQVSRSLKELIEGGIIRRLQSTHNGKLKNFYAFTDDFFTEIGQGCITTGVMPVINNQTTGVETGENLTSCNKTTGVETGKHEKEHENLTNLSNGFEIKTKFQERFKEVLEKLSMAEIEHYKSLKGYEKEPFLIEKKKRMENEERSEQEKREREAENERIRQERENNPRGCTLAMLAGGYILRGACNFERRNTIELMKTYNISREEVIFKAAEQASKAQLYSGEKGEKEINAKTAEKKSLPAMLLLQTQK